HLLFSVTDPQFRVKPAGVSDIMWAEAMGKLEGMESADRERLWPQHVQGFKDLSQRLKGGTVKWDGNLDANPFHSSLDIQTKHCHCTSHQ
ncbi:nuclear pore complex protein Nup54-like, partial [Trifolium medium]|nr:nuclear pore complex protein Nup54-like [Trifolium medium]